MFVGPGFRGPEVLKVTEGCVGPVFERSRDSEGVVGPGFGGPEVQDSVYQCVLCEPS